MSKKIAYVVNINLPPNEWAHTIQVLEMCEAFSKNENKITLIVPKRNLEVDYGLINTMSFKVNQLFCIDLSDNNVSKVFYYLRIFSFYISVFCYFIFKKDFDLIYSRDDYSAFFLSNVVLEKHSFPKKLNFIQKIAFKRAKKIVVLTSFLKKKFVDLGIPEKNIFVSPDAVDMKVFDLSTTEHLKKSDFGFADEDFVLGYVGALKTMGMDKGLNDLFFTLKNLESNFKCLVVGGWGDDLEFYKNLAKNLGIKDRVYFTGKVPHKEVVKYMKVCDILTAPFPENEHYSYYMSPLKIFEYMASNVPILTTNLPSIREILTDGQNSVLANPGDIESIKEGVLKIASNKSFGEQIAKNAYEEVKSKYTWQKRAEQILKFINENGSHNPNIQ